MLRAGDAQPADANFLPAVQNLNTTRIEVQISGQQLEYEVRGIQRAIFRGDLADVERRRLLLPDLRDRLDVARFRNDKLERDERERQTGEKSFDYFDDVSSLLLSTLMPVGS